MEDDHEGKLVTLQKTLQDSQAKSDLANMANTRSQVSRASHCHVTDTRH